MKSLIMFACLSAWCLGVVNGQSLRPGNDAAGGNTQRSGAGRVEALKIAYITREMNLTESEAQRFWPVYNDYSDELKTTRIENRESPDNLDAQEKILAVKRKYEAAFTRVLNKEKAAQFFRAENNFRKYAARELNERREQRQSYR